MNDPALPKTEGGSFSREETHAALFAQLVLQQTNLALMLMGKVPHPETGKATRDLEAARLFIDQLEMLEVKTKGNLSREEGRLLQQSLMTLRMSFVEAVEAPPADATAAPQAQSAVPESTPPPAEPASAAAEEESRKRFSKKY
jgi:hypothetical protein